MRYLLSTILCLWAGCAWAFGPGFLGAVTQSGSAAPSTETLLPNWAATYPTATNINWLAYNTNDSETNQIPYLADNDDGTYVYHGPGTANYIIPVVDTALSCTGGSVTLYARAKSTVGGDQTYFLIYDGTYMLTANRTLTTSYADYQHTFNAAADAGSWTQAKVNGLGVGMSNQGTQSGTISVAKMWVVRTCP